MSFARSFHRNKATHYLVAIVLGVSSGFYLFNEPLKRQFEEQQKQLAAQQAEAAAAAASGAAAPASAQPAGGAAAKA